MRMGVGDRLAPAVFILPAVLVVLAMSIFPLLVSLYLSLTRFKLVSGGWTFDYIGLLNYKKLLVGSQQFHFLGKLAPLSPVAWVVMAVVAGVYYWRARTEERHLSADPAYRDYAGWMERNAPLPRLARHLGRRPGPAAVPAE